MINNFEQIKPLLTFPIPNSFYFVEIIKRRKENPEMDKHAETLRDFYITSLESFERDFPKMVEYCDKFNARAYFRLNVRDAEMISLQCNKRFAELMITKDWKAWKRVYPSIAGEFHSDPNKHWLIDLDYEDFESRAEFSSNKLDVLNKIEELYTPDGNHFLYATIPTPNGQHLIVRPFRLDAFKKAFPNVDVHRDNPCVLYMP